ncbi:hypothetical protein L3X38_000121, partial [Prunus dulcis]
TTLEKDVLSNKQWRLKKTVENRAAENSPAMDKHRNVIAGSRLSCLEKNDLVMLLKECRELVLLDVRECEGFDERDEEILKLVSHIRCWKL